jgi:putative aldouronate transport system permease protein
MIRERSFSSTTFDVINRILLALMGLICVLPLLHIIAVSFSDRPSTAAQLVIFWPIHFNIANYQYVFQYDQFRTSFMISIMRTLGATPLTLLVTILTAYPLSIKDEFPGKQIFKWVLIFSMIFSGGLIPWFLVLRQLKLINSLWGLILPGIVVPWNIIIALNFFRGLPVELAEAAEIDGASHLDILFRIYLPLSQPVIATLGLFTAVASWNAWFDGLIVMNDVTKYPLQTYLQTLLNLQNQAGMLQIQDPHLYALVSQPAVIAVEIILTTLPILFLFPFLQRYFVKGLVLGSIKG